MKKQILFLIVIIIMCLGVFLFVTNHKSEKTDNNIIQIQNFNLQNRICVKKENEYIIGENIKEIDNGYYDLKIVDKKGKIEMYINKLWYESYNEDYIQEDYLADICKELVSQLKINDNKEELEYILYTYIKESYVKSRRKEQIKDILLDNLTISIELEDNVPKLIIEGV